MLYKSVSQSELLAPIAAVLQADVIKATKYVAPNLIVRAVKKTFRVNNRKPDGRGNTEITLTIGRPNYAERELVKMFQKANEPFPVKKVQLKLYTARPKAKNLKKHGRRK